MQAIEQLRLEALNLPAKKLPIAPGIERGRRRFRKRRQWLFEVDKCTRTHRELLASIHALAAQLALDPTWEPAKSPPPPRPAKPPSLKWCECDGVVMYEDHLGLEQCVGDSGVEGCGGVIEPTEPAEWRAYGEALLSRTGRSASWCRCYDVTWERPTPPAMVVDDQDGIEVCGRCKGTFEPCDEDGWQTLMETLYRDARMIVTRKAEAYLLHDREALLETGYHLDESPELQPAKDRDFARAIGLPAPPRSVPPRPLPRGPVAPRGSVSAYHWHKSREAGQIEKLERVMLCRTTQITRRCTACDKPGPDTELTCGNHRLCLHCRGQRVNRFQRRFRDAQKVALEGLWRDRLKITARRKGNRPDGSPRQGLRNGGEWNEKFLTVTIPHSGNIRDDVRQIQKGWPKFWRLLKAHVEKDLLADEHPDYRKMLMAHMRYCRVLEVTPGEDGRGHAHMHLWLVLPFVHNEVIAHLWGEALDWSYKRRLAASNAVRLVDDLIENLPDSRKAFGDQLRSYLVTMRGKYGQPLVAVWKPSIDIRKVKSGQVAAELCKYLIKDAEKKAGELDYIEPRMFARIYAALEGRRAICSSRGLFIVLESECYCHDCGGMFKLRFEPILEDGVPRGPPDQLELDLEPGDEDVFTDAEPPDR